jgi:hypothetical protein
LKSAPPAPPELVVVPPPLDGVVGVGVAVPPPVFCGVVVTGGVTAVPPLLDGVEEDELELELGVVVVEVDVVVVEVDEESAEAAGVPPDGGAVSGGGSVGTL